VLETGFGSVVVQTSDEVIFRVARHTQAAEGHTKEANLLPVLAPRLPVSVPQPQWRAEPGSPGLPRGAIGYRRLAGEPLTPTWLARHDADKVASEIAKFLIALHRFPVEQAVQLGVPPADVNGCSFEALRRQVMSVLYDVLTPEEYDTVSRWSDGFLADPALQHFDAVLSHGDFWFGNVLVNDESESVVAVLDWTSAAIGDPAEDLARQLHLGETFASRVLRAYESRRGAVDPASEPHDTARHLAEYTSLDAEIGFIRDHFDVMAVVREALAGMVDALHERAARALELLEVVLPEVPAEIPWLHFADTGVKDVDLAPADERRLCEEHGEWLFVTGFPMAKRPFYTHPEPGRPQYSNSFDLLFRGMEIVTGGQRLHRYQDYVAALDGVTEPYDGYLQAFKYGMPPHGGFALGLARWLAQLVGARNIRETTLFPRDLNRLVP
jgi:aminoglycoside phosphotransferase (APT) family kinase protein